MSHFLFLLFTSFYGEILHNICVEVTYSIYATVSSFMEFGNFLAFTGDKEIRRKEMSIVLVSRALDKLNAAGTEVQLSWAMLFF